MHRRPRLTAAARAALAAGPVVVVAGCAGAVDVDAAPYAADPRCAEVMVLLRSGGFDELADRSRRDTTAQSTAAWGDPPVVLRCGVEPPGPTTDVCVNVNGVDWVATETDGTAVLTTYGRDPAVQVTVPSDDRSGTDAVLAALSSLVTRVPQARECL